MKKIAILSFLIYSSLATFGQDFSSSISSAKSAYSSGNLDDARFSLEQALHELDQEVGREILKLLPERLIGANYDESEDNVVGTNLGFAGLFVDRNYYNEGQQVRFQVIGNSPLLAGINAILALPTFIAASGSDQKRIRVDGYKSLMQSNESGDGVKSYTIQIPSNDALITLECTGYSENEATSAANQIPVSQIFKLSQ